MTGWIIAGSLILGLPTVAVVIWWWRTRDRAPSPRHAAPPSFPAETIPYTRVDGAPPWQVERARKDVRAAAWDRPWLHADLPRAAPYRPDRLALMAARYEPPQDLPGEGTADHGREPRAVIGKAVGNHHRARVGDSPLAGELAPHVIAALTRAGSEDTVVTPHDLEYLTGGDPWDGLGSSDAWLDRLFAQVVVR